VHVNDWYGTVESTIPGWTRVWDPVVCKRAAGAEPCSCGRQLLFAVADAGTFHFVATSDLEVLEYSSRTLMPSDYGSTLSPNELNVVSYLMSVPNASTSPAETHEKESEEE
jgi:hypothetical protein